MADEPIAIRIPLSKGASVSGLLHAPSASRAIFVCAPGAGAGITHFFMESLSVELAERRVVTLRYQFSYREEGRKRPDAPATAHRVVRAACAEALKRFPALPLFAGGKSFGGRMTSGSQATEPMPGVRGLIFLGFPLHPAGAPSDARAAHLDDVDIPMLFLQGTRDQLATLPLLLPVIERLQPRATLKLFEEADHSFHVPARTGRTDAMVRREIAEKIEEWTTALV